MSIDPAAIMFPNDGPAGGGSGLGGTETQSEGPREDRAAAALFPSERTPHDVALDPDAEPAEALFQDDVPDYDASAVTDMLEGFANSAVADGDIDRADELHAASEAFSADFEAAGTPPEDVAEIMAIYKDAQSGLIAGPVSAERLEAEQAAGLSLLADEGVTDADLGAARSLIADMERIAPGTMASLEATGAGNDLRLVRKVIAEAKRRGYK